MTSFLRVAPPPKKNPGSAPALDQLGVAVHHSSSFVSITISTISLWKVQAASCIDGDFIFFKLAKAGKTGQNI